MDYTALRLTLILAASTTAILTAVGLPIAYWLATSRWRGNVLIESLVALPLVLPPTVMGFYILRATGPHSPLGSLYAEVTGGLLPFSFPGILLGSVLFNFPFAVRPFTAAFAGMNRRLVEASWCLGESRWNTFRRVTLPLCWPGVLAGIVLTFAHSVGEFGVVLMVGGNIPGVTRTLSIAIYDDVQALDYASAGRTSLLLVLFSLVVLCIAQALGRRGVAGMTDELTARFERRFPRGAVIAAELTQPTDRFSVTVLFGPSGCGKTTVLRCLAGLERPDSGRIEFNGETWFDAKRRIFQSPQRRGIGFLFQEYALFPHLTVAENIGYGMARQARNSRREPVAEMMRRFQLENMADRYPHQVSGGQQQRIALARVLVRRPRLLLLDEPLSALDSVLREELRRQLRRLLADFAIPVVVVTHDRIEAMALGDRIAVMDAGGIRQQGTVAEVFSRPLDLAVARIVGVETIQPGTIIQVEDGLATVQIGEKKLLAVAVDGIGAEVHVCIKGEDVALQRSAPQQSSVRNQLPATVTWITPEGSLIRVGLDCGFELSALISRPACAELQLQVGDMVTAGMKVSSVHLMPRTGATVV